MYPSNSLVDLCILFHSINIIIFLSIIESDQRKRISSSVSLLQHCIFICILPLHFSIRWSTRTTMMSSYNKQTTNRNRKRWVVWLRKNLGLWQKNLFRDLSFYVWILLQILSNFLVFPWIMGSEVLRKRPIYINSRAQAKISIKSSPCASPPPLPPGCVPGSVDWLININNKLLG